MEPRDGNEFCDFCGRWMNEKTPCIIAPVKNNAAIICLPCVRLAAAQADRIEGKSQAGKAGE